MNILILNRKSLRTRPICKWFEEENVNLFLCCDEKARDKLTKSELDTHYKEAIFVKDYSDSGEIEWATRKLHKRYGIDRIASFSELDVLRAAYIRESLGIPGQNVTSARAFRDKYLMKSIAQNSGIKIPEMAMVHSPYDLFAFIEAVGYPVVLKPRDLGGSLGIHVIEDEEALLSLINMPEGPLSPENNAHLMVEKFIDGPLYHIDGIMKAGSVQVIWASKYISQCLESLTDGKNVGGVILSTSTEIHLSLCEFVEKVIDSLPVPNEQTSFHAEVFIEQSSNELYLCEIASRTGGGGIVEMFEAASGINLNRVSIRGQAGFNEHFSEWESPLPYGFISVLAKRGKLITGPETCALDGVEHFKFSGQPNKTYDGPKNCVDAVATALISGQSEAHVASRLAKFENWAFEKIIWKSDNL